MVMESLPGQTAKSTKETIRTTRGTERASIPGPMERSTSATGRMENRMEMADSTIPRVVSGEMVRGRMESASVIGGDR